MDRHLYLFLLLVLLGIAVSPRSYAQQPADAAPVIREIAFRGIEHLSTVLSNQLTESVKSRVGEPFDQKTTDADTQALLDLGWFTAVGTAIKPVDGGVCLIFQVVEHPTVINVKASGLKNASDKQRQQVDNLLKSLAGLPFNPKHAEGLLALGIFYNVTYQQEPVAGGIRLVYTLIENPIITGITFTTTGPLTEGQLRKAIATQPDELMNENQIHEDGAAIRKAYVDAGYSLVQVNMNMSAEAKLSFDIFLPEIGEIHVKGNAKTTEAAIREQLTFKTGDYYNEKAISTSLAKVGKLPTIIEVRAIPEQGKEKGTLNINIEIREK